MQSHRERLLSHIARVWQQYWQQGFKPSSERSLHVSNCQLQLSRILKDAEEFAETTKKVKVTINGRQVVVPEGISILQAASQLGVSIPTLCTHPRLPHTPGTCRICLVEESGKLRPACATAVTDGMVVETDTETVRQSVRGILALLKANHPLDCMTCDVSGRCEFQDLLRRYNVGEGLPALRHFSHEWDDEVQSDFEQLHDTSSPSIRIDLEKCLKCGRCVAACGLVQEMNVLGWTGRGRARHPALLSPDILESKCIECGQCSSVCPVGAIQERSEWREVLDALDSRRKVLVAMTAPAVRVAIGEELGLGPGVVSTGQMVTAQRQLGFDYVLDVNFGADLTIIEEATELLGRLKQAWALQSEAMAGVSQIPKGEDTLISAASQSSNTDGPSLPMFTSCCPAWVTLVEKSFPEFIPNLSSCKSPQQMMGAIVKRYFAHKIGVKADDICLVSFMPCTAKKHESEREELKIPGIPMDVDYVLTTREFGHILRLKKIPLASLPEGRFDSPLGTSSGAAILFGATGGVMEAALRTAYELITGRPMPKLEVEAIRGIRGLKEAVVTLPSDCKGLEGKEIRVAVASGVGNARHLLEAMAAGRLPRYDFIEVMACPGGCIGGGGQPKSKDIDVVLKRMGAIYSLDQAHRVRKSHENPEVGKLYDEYLKTPGGALSHKLLHTRYTDRSSS